MELSAGLFRVMWFFEGFGLLGNMNLKALLRGVLQRFMWGI